MRSVSRRVNKTLEYPDTSSIENERFTDQVECDSSCLKPTVLRPAIPHLKLGCFNQLASPLGFETERQRSGGQQSSLRRVRRLARRQKQVDAAHQTVPVRQRTAHLRSRECHRERLRLPVYLQRHAKAPGIVSQHQCRGFQSVAIIQEEQHRLLGLRFNRWGLRQRLLAEGFSD